MSQDNLVDPSYELLDPCPDVHALFLDFNDRYFNGALAGCEVKWSPRMTSCAGICSYEGRGGLCSVRLSKPLLSLRPRSDLIETLLHEMIHAYLFVTQRNRDRDGHGPDFQSHMHRINGLANTKISIYHTFHQEVAVYKQHWWRCDGSCKDQRPFYGWVKRASNRAPGPNDRWWADHRSRCGGNFIKVKEPEGYGAKKKPVGTKKTIAKTTPTSPTRLDTWIKKDNTNGSKSAAVNSGGATQPTQLFGGEGQTSGIKPPEVTSPVKVASAAFIGSGQRLGGGSQNPPVVQRNFALLDRLEQMSSTIKRGTPPVIKNISSSSSSHPDLITIDDADDVVESKPGSSKALPKACPTNSDMNLEETRYLEDQLDSVEQSAVSTVECPSCGRHVASDYINAHLDYCAD